MVFIHLHDRVGRGQCRFAVRLRAWQMAALIACTGLLTYALNPAAGMIAVASACAFSAAALVPELPHVEQILLLDHYLQSLLA